jgi:hypothetical protein
MTSLLTAWINSQLRVDDKVHSGAVISTAAIRGVLLSTIFKTESLPSGLQQKM